MKSRWKELIAETKWFFSANLPRWQKALLQDLRRRVPDADDVLWMLSSGTQSLRSVKALALKYEGILCSAEAANAHLQSSTKDRWGVAIPHYYIGGLAIYARAELSGAQVFTFTARWSAEAFAQFLKRERISLTSLVPTQVHDLVSAGLSAPESLRAIVVGGGKLESSLYHRARELGWPLLPSYGLTECCSQVATASLASLQRRDFPDFEILKHAEFKFRNQLIYLRSPALCKWIATADSDGQFTLEDPRAWDGWYKTADLGELRSGRLHILGRNDDVVKVLGVLVSTLQVEDELRGYLGTEVGFTLLARPDLRRENSLLLVVEGSAALRSLVQDLKRYNELAIGPRRVESMLWLEKIPRGEMGKVKKAELRRFLGL